MVLLFHFDFPANAFFFFLEGSLHIAWKILCSLGISREGDMHAFLILLRRLCAPEQRMVFGVLDRNPLQECEGWI